MCVVVAGILGGIYGWVGGVNIGGTWTWLDGKEWNYTNWAEGEPSDGGQDCVQIYADGYWDNYNCEKTNHAFVCKRSI
ncbi:lectin C-type domain protein [Ostertagia ostertagi]